MTTPSVTIFEVSRPPSLWDLYQRRRNGALAKSKRYQTWLNSEGWAVKGLKPVSEPVDVVVKVARTITQKGQWSRKDGDCDNFAKPVLDLLVSQGTLPDDNAAHVHSIQVRWVDQPDIPQGTCRVYLYPVECRKKEAA